MRRAASLLMLLALAGALLIGAAVARAADGSLLAASGNDRCFECHAADGQNGTVTVGGSERSIKVHKDVYEASRHGMLACTSCHIGFEAHAHTAAETEGWLATAKISACRNCHADQFGMYRGSFHGQLVFGKSDGRAPVCADCHEAHNIVTPGTPEFRRSVLGLCSRCHQDYSETYLDSYHGKAYFLGNDHTAVCTNCHGGHKILPASDPASRVSEQRIVHTCATCHPGANENFAGFMVHVNPKDPGSSFVVWTFYALYILLIAVVFTFGATHSGLYIYRGIKDGLYSRKH